MTARAEMRAVIEEVGGEVLFRKLFRQTWHSRPSCSQQNLKSSARSS
jgi:hypothetical protein